MLLFTCIKLVAHLLACALAIAHGSLLKCDQLKVFSLGITLVDVVQNWFNWFHFLFVLGGLFVILIDCMVFLSPFLDVTRMLQDVHMECCKYILWGSGAMPLEALAISPILDFQIGFPCIILWPNPFLL